MVTFVSVLKYEQLKVNKALEQELAAMPAPLRDIVSHVLMAGGKRLRPLLTLLSARLFGADGPQLYELAVIPDDEQSFKFRECIWQLFELCFKLHEF